MHPHRHVDMNLVYPNIYISQLPFVAFGTFCRFESMTSLPHAHEQAAKRETTSRVMLTMQGKILKLLDTRKYVQSVSQHLAVQSEDCRESCDPRRP